MVLGVAAMICVMPVPRTSMRIDLPLMLFSFALLFVFCLPGADGYATITKVEGAILFICLCLYTYMSIRLGKVSADEVLEDDGSSFGASAFKIVVGIVLLAIGGELTLNGGVNMAEDIGMSQRVIGLTVMAIGTSLPELATSIQAARKGETDIAVANILGSNCFNILSILGISALITPLPVNEGILYWDYWWMIGVCVLILPAMLLRHAIGKVSGVLLLVAIAVYFTLLIAMPELGVPQQSASTDIEALSAP
jgi:cation:H+ antiporter